MLKKKGKMKNELVLSGKNETNFSECFQTHNVGTQSIFSFVNLDFKNHNVPHENLFLRFFISF